MIIFFFFSSRRRHTRFSRDWSSDVCSSDLEHLDVESRVPDQALLDEQLRRHVGPGVEALEVADVDRVRLGAVRAHRHRVLRVRAALLPEAHVDGHLTALEPGAHLVRARTGLLALDPAARVPALARAQATAYPLP